MVKMEMLKGAEMSICGVQLQSDVSIFFPRVVHSRYFCVMSIIMSCLYVRTCNTKAEKQKIYMHGTASQDKADMQIYSHTILGEKNDFHF